jgi:hypothetical protein
LETRFATLSVRQLRAGKYFESLFCGTEEQTTVYQNVEKKREFETRTLFWKLKKFDQI